ncbi:MAG: tRNA guanosine(34) transglycosylase Tgt [Planctomycetaceae bacterium]
MVQEMPFRPEVAPEWSAGSGLHYQLLTTSGRARRGRFVTAHGTVETPSFMPVGTQGAVKCVLPDQLAATGAQVVLANTYHLGILDRTQVVERLGGLHSMMRWNQTILTDSGGFQVFSLPDRKISEEGVTFRFVTARSGDAGQMMTLSPESAMDIQRRLGADIVMAFDECVDHRAPPKYMNEALNRTHRWLKRCAECPLQEHQHLFGIIQGGMEPDLRSKAVQQVTSLNLPGYAIGGVSVGEGHEAMVRVVRHTAPLMPANQVRYLMGVGLPEDIVAAVGQGMDIFDCIIPTRYARNGTVFTWDGKMRLQDKTFRKDRYPIDRNCECVACAGGYSRAYLRHLSFADEPIFGTLTTIHNLHFYQDMMRAIRLAIQEDRFHTWADAFCDRYLPKSGSAQRRDEF